MREGELERNGRKGRKEVRERKRQTDRVSGSEREGGGGREVKTVHLLAMVVYLTTGGFPCCENNCGALQANKPRFSRRLKS